MNDSRGDDGHLFISYSRHGDSAVYTKKFADYLASCGLTVWYDVDIIAGDQWDTVIQKKIATCTAMIVVMTEQAQESVWVSREITEAELLRKPIYPLLLSGRHFFRLGNLQYEDVSDGRMPSTSLIASLCRHLPVQPAAPTEARAATPQPVASAPPSIQAQFPLTGHKGSVLSVAISPDGQWFATGGSDGTLRLWNPHTREPIGQPLTGHIGAVYSVAISPDGQWIATGSDLLGGPVRLWSPRSGLPIGQPFAGHNSSVPAVAISPDGQWMATGSGDRTVRLWNPKTGQPIGQPLTGHTGSVYSVAISPDGQWIATSSHDGTLRLWTARL